MPDNYMTFFVSTDDHKQILRELCKKMDKYLGSALAFSFISLVLFVIAVEQRQKLEELENRFTQHEMAG